ncbi:unnamed protein product [Closterium sp. NIES-65]|nr:unnamed protein product [Closterium sp. NIES-65]
MFNTHSSQALPCCTCDITAFWVLPLFPPAPTLFHPTPPPISLPPPNPSSHLALALPSSLQAPHGSSTSSAHSGHLALSYWLHSVSARKLRARGLSPLTSRGPGVGGGLAEGTGGSTEETGGTGDGEGVGTDGGEWGGVNVVVKTHEWAEGWEVGEWIRVVLLTERDVCGVADSYLRVGWLPHSMPPIRATRPTTITGRRAHFSSSLSFTVPPSLYLNLPFPLHARMQVHQGLFAILPACIKAHMQAYLRDHHCWKQHVALIIPFASIVPLGSPSELLCLSRLAALLGLFSMEGEALGSAKGVVEGVAEWEAEWSGLEGSERSEERGTAGGRAVSAHAVSRALAQLLVPTGTTFSPLLCAAPKVGDPAGKLRPSCCRD